MNIRNREERSTAIWRFVGVAAIPLVLLFLAGFCLGNTAGNEQGKLRDEIQGLQTQLEQCNNQVGLYKSFFVKADALMKKIKTGSEDLEKSLDAAVKDQTGSGLLNWEDESLRFYRQMSREIDEMELDALQKNKTDSVFIVSFESFRTCNRLYQSRLELLKQLNSGALGQDQKDELQKQRDDIAKQMDALNTQSKIQTAEAKVMTLQTQLDQCRSDLARAGAGAGAGAASGPDKKAIRAELEKIKGEVIPNMQTRWIGNDNTKMNALREKLRTNISNIESSLGK